jgi:glutathionylspermidine synthase
MFPVRYMVAQKMEKEELTKALEEKIPSWAREHGGKLNAILKGSDAAFKQAKDRFLDQLEDHLKVSMAKLYTPEQIMRREREIGCQLSQNMADPERQKSLEGMMKFMVSAGVTVSWLK